MKNIYFFADKTRNGFKKQFSKLIEMVTDATLEHEQIASACEISVTFVKNAQIQKINKQYRQKDSATDVLSFPTSDIDEELILNPDSGAYVLGDVVISVEKAMEQAQEYGHSIEREIAFLTVHSVLHLLGYDHEISEDEEQIMEHKQEEILKRLNILR